MYILDREVIYVCFWVAAECGSDVAHPVPDGLLFWLVFYSSAVVLYFVIFKGMRCCGMIPLE